MPEGPECTIVANSLNEIAKDKTLTNITPISGRYLRNPIANLDKLKGAEILGVCNKGKFIYWVLDNGFYLFSTLGMSGIYSLTRTPHTRVAFLLDNSLEVCYNDVRNFGTMKVAEQADLDKKLKELGPDMLNDPCTYNEFEKIINKNSKKILGLFLMDQKKVSGIGNIYKAEACYLAGINPSRTLCSLSETEKRTLYRSIIEVLQIAFDLKGSSQKDFTDIEGNPGAFLQDYAKVYRKQMDIYGNPVESVVLPGDDRTTWWCPNVQK
jgi:formamidopyrimidine-DNA glycosylase